MADKLQVKFHICDHPTKPDAWQITITGTGVKAEEVDRPILNEFVSLLVKYLLKSKYYKNGKDK